MRALCDKGLLSLLQANAGDVDAIAWEVLGACCVPRGREATGRAM